MSKPKILELEEKMDNQIETFDLTMETGYTQSTDNVNKGYYNKITKQVTLVFFIYGTFNNEWKTIASIPEKYRPTGGIYIECTYGAGRSLINITPDGTVKAFCNTDSSQIRGMGTYYTF